MPTIADNFFTCMESPANFPSGLKLSGITESPTSVLRIISKIPGPGNYTGPTDFYFDINENPTTSVHFNGAMFNLTTCYLCFPGVHKVVGEEKVCDAEIVATFKPSQTSTSSSNTNIVMCIPVESGISMNPDSQRYFSTLTTGATANRPTFGSIFHAGSKFITYNGFDFMKRVVGGKIVNCNDIPDSPGNIVRYFVCQNRIGMTIKDYDRFRAQLAYKPRPAKANDYTPLEQVIKPPTSSHEIASARFTTLVTLITNVSLETGDDSGAGKIIRKPNGIPVSSMKCKPLRSGRGRVDMTKDTTSLKDVIAKSDAVLRNENGDPEMPSEPSSLAPEHVEQILSVFFGILFAVLVCAGIAFLIQWGVFRDYLKVLNRNETGGLSKFKASDIKSFKMPSMSAFKFPDIPKLVCPPTE